MTSRRRTLKEKVRSNREIGIPGWLVRGHSRSRSHSRFRFRTVDTI